ncbi:MULTISPECIES: signal peptidase II [unclassified Roseovarius]|uniref:signal peptidase II n=1 Tax=unclassified Roseovarius TaxID=2614913 RepID=UPI00273EC11D|nr:MULTISPECIES: signal peptidase II [unclassified Roseovarius]
MRSLKGTPAIGMLAALAAFAIDQVTKAIVVTYASVLSAVVPVFPGFNLTFHRNDGVTFGLLGGAPWWSLAILALAVCAWLAIMMLRTENGIEALAYGAIIGGALGNVVDRVRYRAVTDFLDFYVGSAHWPAFNIADVFVVGGVGLLLAAPMMQRRF